MKNLLTVAIVLLALVLMSVNFGETQTKPKKIKQVRFGHVDMAEVLQKMPQIKQANAKLEAQRKQSIKQLVNFYKSSYENFRKNNKSSKII